MRNKILFALAIVGVLVALYSAHLYTKQPPAQPAVFNPAANPYSDGIYANGIIESFQSHGENINIYPEVSGPIVKILVAEGAVVKQGTPLLTIDDSVQRATADQQKSQADAALAMLNELKAEPRPEALAVAEAQVASARASWRTVQDEMEKQEQAYTLSPGAVSRDAVDNARNAVKVAESNMAVAQKQFELIKAGTWTYEIQNQEKQYEALSKAFAASNALLMKYTISAPVDGVVLSIQASIGSYVSQQGAYSTYTQGFQPVIVMGSAQDVLEVRCYIDEILVHRLPNVARITGRMFIRGTDLNIPLTFERLQPYVSPKIELANQRQERVDVRVLPMIFRFDKPKGFNLYPGQLVDVYIGERDEPTTSATPGR